MSMQSVRLADGSNWYVDKDNKVIRVLYRQWLTPAKWRKATKSETKRVLRVSKKLNKLRQQYDKKRNKGTTGSRL